MTYKFYSEVELIQQLTTKIRQQRLLHNLSQQELADRADLSLITVQRIEAGNNCSLQNLIKLLMVFNLAHRLLTIFDNPVSSISEKINSLEQQQRQRVRKPKK